MIARTVKTAAQSEPVHSAHSAGLRYVNDQMPGICRERAGKDWRYRYPTGDPVKEPEVLARIKSLAIPPAWKEVWICPDPCGHLQATGRDDRERKQPRYHPRWRVVRDETKYNRMIEFGKALPEIRRRLKKDLRLPGLCREKVLATVVRLLEVSLIRIGNEEYARDNASFGLTTMRDRHVKVRGGTARFHFRGKSGKWHDVDIRDARLAKIIKRCQDLPGQELFQYVDEKGKRQCVDSNDVNEYLRNACGKDFTAKDFRTWSGTVLGAMALTQFEDCKSQRQAKKNIGQAIEQVAQRLGNTVAVCRKCYVHPDVISAYLDGELLQIIKPRLETRNGKMPAGLTTDEAAVFALLKERLAAQKKREKPLPELLKRSLALARKAAK
jgi:DNA topoisomerase I